ncbi:MAG: NADH-quinone oxidoreductase subunit NuoF [Phycisphaerae bacterium]|nr:NADH-quinone oxidoreductase subunit NuoF [Phycisphaerae bacterium]NIP55341.1 NADH-quinone oxidoreductase subunit NuoF [Phycisphaerae bacterium]NIS54110.1 NADH-quinone oxidoreductase subunit NuoF [Phycisphaerae bacterium]NIU11662.1 NADH-quinone oxidoreductase subunit NuoF [Phycisphaerae bacterium]NIU59484.1 NADH-quinone oxidoreductase subunit NuoF [Phycisphaerae bacterium]
MSAQHIKSINDLEQLQQDLLSRRQDYKARVLICATGCRALGAQGVATKFREKLQSLSLDKQVHVIETGCIGMCARAPVVLIEPYEYLYGGVSEEDIDELISTTIQNGKAVERLAVVQDGKPVPGIKDIDFYKKQDRLVLENCGRIDPRRIEDAIERGAYLSTVQAVTQKKPQQIIDEVTESGLRGRGGAGFPAGVKWNFCRKSEGEEKYLICNADEGDPGAFMDRALLEGDPHRVIEGMILAAYAIGAGQGFIYVRAEYPIAVEHINIALEQARSLGLLGDDIAGSGFGFDIEVRMGAGAFVCGEETALIASLEGKRGMPNTRPPFPAQKGYLDKPTNINNVETFANVPLVMKHGVDWYKQRGTEKSKGTKIFALAGRVNNTGLVEVPMGATLREIVFDIGGGIPQGRKFKAAQMGGPSGGCIPAQYLDTEIDYDSVQQIGAIMGSGGLIIMDENTCMVDVARYFLEFVQSESCGKCTPCRVGTGKMLRMLEAISRGEARVEDLDYLEHLAEHVKDASLCGLGQTAPNPVLSTLRHFREEYVEHIVLKTCRAAVCEGLVRASCQHACPAGVNVPEYLALAAEGKLNEAANLIRRRNPFISVCGRVCDHPCEQRCRRSDIDRPLAIRALKRYIADNMDDYETLMARRVEEPAEVAIVGSGPAGLSCAYFLAILQRSSVIFEAQPIPGGMLALGIPEFRLPKETLQKEIDFILSHGVELRTNSRVENVRELINKGFKAVFVATGAQLGKGINIEGIELDGVFDALELLRQRALGKGRNCDGKAVVVLGGGNVAVDAARSVVRLGAKKVTVLYRRTREEMPAYEEEIEEAIQEGIEIITLGIPKRILSKNGSVSGIEYIRAELGKAEADGRRRPVPVEGSESVIECDMVIPAIGQVASTEAVKYSDGPELTDWGTIKVNPVSHNTTVGEIFSGGDCVSGPSSVIAAIASGQKAAVHIDKMLGGTGELPGDVGFSFVKPDDETLEKAPPRAQEKYIALEKRKRGFAEVVLGLDREQAVGEARRCFRCDLEK